MHLGLNTYLTILGTLVKFKNFSKILSTTQHTHTSLSDKQDKSNNVTVYGEGRENQ